MIITNHLYPMEGKLYHQKNGGPIGGRITTILARMVMNIFGRRFVEVTNKLGLQLPLLKRYVDYVNGASRRLGRRVRVVVREGMAALQTWGETEGLRTGSQEERR